MAFDATTFQKIAGGPQQVFAYKTADTIATVTGSGYFSAVADMINAFDLILVVSETGGTAKVDVVAFTSVRSVTPVTTTATEGVTAT